MGFSLYNLFKASLLVSNGIVILHPKRFLAKYGYDEIDPHGGSSARNQIVGLLQAFSYLKVPLIAINALVILIELIAGG